MRAKMGIFIGIGIVALLIGIALTPAEDKNEIGKVFHVTLADPNLYENGLYKDKFQVENGTYSFRFVPNGDSPQKLTISLNGDNFQFLESFELNGTLHQTGISEYYTWEYVGQKSIEIFEEKELEISIDPHGEILGPVSVSIIEN